MMNELAKIAPLVVTMALVSGCGSSPPSAKAPEVPSPDAPSTSEVAAVGDEAPKSAPESSGFASAEELVKAAFDAVNDGDAAAVDALFPSAENVTAAIRCGEADKLLAKIDKYRTKLHGDVEVERERGTRMTLTEVTEVDMHEQHAAGAEEDGCVFNDSLGMLKIRVTMTVEEQGQGPQNDSDTLKGLKIGERYYLMKF